MKDKDITHLEWVYKRMKYVHDENENYDYMIRFREIIETLRHDFNDEKPHKNYQNMNELINLLKEIKHRLLIDVDENGEPKSSMDDLLKMWEKVDEAENKFKVSNSILYYFRFAEWIAERYNYIGGEWGCWCAKQHDIKDTEQYKDTGELWAYWFENCR